MLGKDLPVLSGASQQMSVPLQYTEQLEIIYLSTVSYNYYVNSADIQKIILFLIQIILFQYLI